MIMERIYLEELKPLLRYRDLRSVRKWCFNNHVKVLYDAGSKWRFVLKEELDKALTIFREEPKTKTFRKKKENHRSYSPQGETEKAFLSTLQMIIF